jgi:hypothetical protein
MHEELRFEEEGRKVKNKNVYQSQVLSYTNDLRGWQGKIIFNLNLFD